VYGDPIGDDNFLLTLHDSQPFTYELNFTASPAVASTASQLLVFDGVKMVADAALNGWPLPTYFDNVFNRFVFDVTGVLRLGAADGNTLTVSFTTSNDTRNEPCRCAYAAHERRAAGPAPVVPICVAAMGGCDIRSIARAALRLRVWVVAVPWTAE
jgi:hypothetical protein